MPSLPPFSCSCSDSLYSRVYSSHLEPAVGGKSKRKREVLVEQARRLASKSIPWRSLPYLREAALADIRVVAKLYGDDLLDISPGESFLNLREARELLESIPASRWRQCLNKQGELKPAALSNSVDFLEIFSGCGHLTLGAARQGLQVGPSIDKRPGIGHDNAFFHRYQEGFRPQVGVGIGCGVVPTLDSLRISMHFLGSDCSLDAYSRLG